MNTYLQQASHGLRRLLSSSHRLQASCSSRLASQCWKCRKTFPKGFPIHCNDCNVIQPIRADQDYFGYFGMDQNFELNPDDLKKKFWKIQSVVHPDKYGMNEEKEQKYAELHSSFANQAYKTLQNPRSRALYMLELSKVEPSETDPAFAMEILELSEEIEEMTKAEDLNAKKHEIEASINELLDSVAANFDKGANEEARESLNRLRYYDRMKKLVVRRLDEISQ
uniref:J domain-containing protein n=1 Tax=Panagrellus redivivus TaxID=6233 RepID=A0A7E4VZ68_PANRE